VSVARLIITALVVDKQTVAQVAARFGGSSPMSHEWVIK
jgi:transposase-like protein